MGPDSEPVSVSFKTGRNSGQMRGSNCGLIFMVRDTDAHSSSGVQKADFTQPPLGSKGAPIRSVSSELPRQRVAEVREGAARAVGGERGEGDAGFRPVGDFHL